MRYILYILITIISSVASGQDSINYLIVNPIENETFDSLSKFVEYNKTKKVFKLKKKFLQEKKPEVIKNKSIPGLKYIIIALVAILMMFLLAVFFSANNKSKKLERKEFDLNNIEDIHEIDSEQLYREALEKGDLRLAIRIQFIKALQSLSQADIIDWQIDKTNRDYLSEINDSITKEQFKKLTFIYDNVWYGNKEINNTIFEIYSQQFKTFISKTNVG